MTGKRQTDQRGGTGIVALVEAVAGIILIIVAVYQLVSSQESLPGFAMTILLVVILLVGVALAYLGIERHKDARRGSVGSHSKDSWD
ncbi:MAG: hypothetical protein SOI23_06650 [Atopobiaceae bacterium]|nr:hypothetical protein [Olegusella sp.]MCI1934291.1 hypothetical protein [Atopobiaceae bacterium]